MTAAPARKLRADAALAATILLLGALLSALGLGLIARWQLSAARGQAPEVDDLLGATAAAGGLAIVAWWTLSVIVATATAVLVRCGRKRAAARAGRYCPAFMRRLAMAVFSVQLLSAPFADAMEPPAGPAWVPRTEVSVDARWSPTPAPGQTRGTVLPAIPSPQPQVRATYEGQAEEIQAPARAPGAAWSPTPPVTDPDLLARQTARTTQGPAAPPAEVTVVAGDTLWDIASRELGSAASDVEVALHWPRWYEANRAQIGENPHVLLPGQILKSPSTA